MKDLQDIKNKLKNIKPKLFTEYEVQQVGIFGSYVRGEATESSDLDILITLKEDHHVGLIKFNALKRFLSELLNIKVDLVTSDGIKPALKNSILNEVTYL